MKVQLLVYQDKTVARRPVYVVQRIGLPLINDAVFERNEDGEWIKHHGDVNGGMAVSKPVAAFLDRYLFIHMGVIP